MDTSKLWAWSNGDGGGEDEKPCNEICTEQASAEIMAGKLSGEIPADTDFSEGSESFCSMMNNIVSCYYETCDEQELQDVVSGLPQETLLPTVLEQAGCPAVEGETRMLRKGKKEADADAGHTLGELVIKRRAKKLVKAIKAGFTKKEL